MIKGAVAVMFDKEGRTLILLRPATDRWMPRKWALVGGKLDNGETPEQALAREVKEETTLIIRSPREFYVSDNGEVLYYIVKDYEGEVCIDYEHDDFAWVYPEDLTNYDVVSGLGALVWRAREMLTYYA
tara:strand:- start:307 stop:693 length:387 start_codon:yes stop_codon:yes gene_type:complete